eukprot:scaffold54650_cov46-Phaeocystis_antarctica.AAC.1
MPPQTYAPNPPPPTTHAALGRPSSSWRVPPPSQRSSAAPQQADTRNQRECRELCHGTELCVCIEEQPKTCTRYGFTL